MEGMSFQTPKGTMTFRKDDHQALQSMYHFRIKVDPAFAWACLSSFAKSSPASWTSHPEQEVMG